MDTKDDICTVPKTFIKQLGLSANEAYVLETLCFQQTKATTVKNGKKWFIRPLARQWGQKGDRHKWYRPMEDDITWLCPQQVHKIIASPAQSKRVKSKQRKDNSLEKRGLIEIDRNFQTEEWKNKYGTLAYHVPDNIMEMYSNAKKRSTLFFRRKDAVELGSVERAVVANILYRVFKTNPLGDDEDWAGKINSHAIATATGFNVRAIRDIIKFFVSKELLATSDGGKTHRLNVPNPWKGKRSKSRNNIVKYDHACFNHNDPEPVATKEHELQRVLSEISTVERDWVDTENEFQRMRRKQEAAQDASEPKREPLIEGVPESKLVVGKEYRVCDENGQERFIRPELVALAS